MIKSRFFAAAVLGLTIAILLCSIPCAASTASDNTVEVRKILDGVLAYKGTDASIESLQDFIDGELTETAGRGAEWYVLALAQYTECDFSSYEKALLSYLENNRVSSASSRLKYALCLAAVGSTDAYVEATLNSSIGKQGIMSWVFGLHLLNNGYVCDGYTADTVKDILLGLQLEDGGWAIMGKVGDVDATAMTVQALAPYYHSDNRVRSALDRALSLLASYQLDGGDYSSYGVSNPESTVQVFVALTSLGIDPFDAEDFIKNGNDLSDGIVLYRLEDGSFSHKMGEKSSENATVQAFYSAVAYMRMREGKTPLYILDRAEPPVYAAESGTEPQKETSFASNRETEATEEIDASEKANGDGGYKLWASLLAVAVGIAICILLFALKKRHLKNFIAVWLLVALAVTVICMTNFKTADQYYADAEASKENIIGTVSISIRCDTVKGRAEHIPDDGVILNTVELEISEGDTVYSVLLEAAKKHRIQIDNAGTDSAVYISGINYLYEFDYGDLSGWTYFVNRERGDVGAGEYVLSDGDIIEWKYTCELGEDLE